MEKIGRHVAAQIRSIPEEHRTKEQLDKLDHYDDPKGIVKAQSEAYKSYSEGIWMQKEKKDLEEPKYEELFFKFKHEFKYLTGNDLSLERERLDDYKTLLCYFSKDERFFECKNVSSLSVRSFDKGLLIMGGYGNGKSSCMKAMSMTLRHFYMRQFKYQTANEVIDKFEACENATQKKSFWKSMANGTKCFDDVKTEREASNFGKYNIFKELIERRYDYNTRTFITCNYKDREHGNLMAGLSEFGDRYGGRVYDRIFEMFNIIEFKGKTFRK